MLARRNLCSKPCVPLTKIPKLTPSPPFRFDEVYVVYFKCNKKLIREFDNIYNYMIDIYQTPGIGEHISMDHIKTHYYSSHVTLNAYSVVPVGRLVDYGTATHNRDEAFP